MIRASYLKIIFGITLLIFAGQLSLSFSKFDNLFDVLLSVLSIFWLFQLYINSSITRTPFFRMLLVFLGTYLIGALFKILHYPGASLLLTISISGIGITYLIRTIKKTKKHFLDWLKLAWVLSTCIFVLGRLEHLIPEKYLFVNYSIYWLMIGVFVFGNTSKVKSQTL